MTVYNYLTGAGIAFILSTGLDVCGQSPAISHLSEAVEYYADYEFDKASRSLTAARKALLKGESLPAIDEYSRRLELAQGFLARIEKIQIIDSICVPEAEFFKAYKLPSSSGFLSTSLALPPDVKNDNKMLEEVEYVFTNEEGDYKLWSAPTKPEEESELMVIQDGPYNIMESMRLTDGSWSAPHPLPAELGGGGNAEYPFMMPDGVTLYYASDGDGSMGGYDIFMATRDAVTGEYLQPMNIGMPYNSPANDYMLAIDEMNGVGWWATDRNAPTDSVNIYVYKVNDFRSNYDPDEEDNLIDYARIANYKDTRAPETDYTDLLKTIAAIRPAVPKQKDFEFKLPGGKVYTNYGDFKTASGRRAMHDFIKASNDADARLDRLAALRKKYAVRPSDRLKNEILDLERSCENDIPNLKRLRNDIYRAEQ